MFLIINKQTGAIVSKCKTINGARKAKDKNDNNYGAYIHIIKESL